MTKKGDVLTLLEWVEEQRKEGIVDAEISMQLVQQGYSQSQITQALRSPFHVEDDPQFVNAILSITFGIAIICAIIIFFRTSLFESSLWAIIFITIAGLVLLRPEKFWQRPKQLMAGLLTFMSVIVFAAGLSGIHWMSYIIIILLSPLSAYIGFCLLVQSRASPQEILYTGQRPMMLLALLFLALEIIAMLVRKSLFSASLAAPLMNAAEFINVHIGFILAAGLFLGSYLLLFTKQYRIAEKKDLYLYYYSMMGYVIGAVIIELLALL